MAIRYGRLGLLKDLMSRFGYNVQCTSEVMVSAMMSGNYRMVDYCWRPGYQVEYPVFDCHSPPDSVPNYDLDFIQHIAAVYGARRLSDCQLLTIALTYDNVEIFHKIEHYFTLRHLHGLAVAYGAQRLTEYIQQQSRSWD